MRADEANAPEGRPEHRDGHGANGESCTSPLSIHVERIATMTHTLMEIVPHESCVMAVPAEDASYHPAHERIHHPAKLSRYIASIPIGPPVP